MQGAPLHDSVLNEWGMGIVSGAYQPGDRISLDDEVTAQQVSRSVGREAIRVLESMGMVRVKRKAGAIVNPPELWNSFEPRLIGWRLHGPDRVAQLHALSELRACVEPMAARLAAMRATPQQWARLSEAAITMVANSKQANEAEYLTADIAFHATLLEASQNVMFAALGGMVEAVLRGRTAHDLMPAQANTAAVQLHVDVAAAIGAQDAARAEHAMREIVAESDQAIVEGTAP